MRLTRCTCVLLLSAACLLNVSAAIAAPINSNLVLKLDAAAANVTLPGPVGPNGMPRVSAWADTSALGGANNATQTTNNARPEYFASVAALNNQPALHFFGSGPTATPGDPDGSFDEMIIGGMTGNFPNASTLLIVGRPETIGSDGTTYNLYDTHNSDSYWNFTGGSGYMGMWRSNRVEGSMPTGGAATSGSQVFELSVRSSAGVGSTLSEYRYFENEVAKGSDPVGSGGPADTYVGGDATHKLGNAQGSVSIKAYEGYVAEVLVYNTALNNAERIISANYLSAKFNAGGTVVGVNNTLGANDHYQGDLSTLNNYDSDVFGIGQIDATNLLATSENNAGLQITGDGSLSNGDWVLAGHKTPINSINGDGSWARVWYIDKTTTDGVNATLTFDYSDGGLVQPGITGQALIQLLYSPTDPFNFSSLGITATISGDQISFFVPNSQLLDGYYTLLAISVPEPSTLALIGFGVVGLAVKARRRRRQD